MSSVDQPSSFLAGNETLRAVLEAIPDAVYAKSLEGRYLYMNAECCEVTGMILERVLGKTDGELWPDVATTVCVDDQLVLKTKRTHTFEESVRLKGEQKTFLSRKTPLFDAAGTLIGLVGVSRDITEHRKGAESLRSKTELLEVLSAAMSVYLERSDWSEAMSLVLQSALRQTGSRFGFVGLRDRPGELIVVREGADIGRGSASFQSGFTSHGGGTDKPIERLRVDALAAWFPPLHQAVSQVLQTGTPLRSALFGSSPMDILSGMSVRHFLGVPIRRGTTVIGIIALCDAPDGFTEGDQRWLESGHGQLAVLCSVYLRQLQEELLEQQRRHAEKSLRESHAYIQQIIQSAQEGIVVYDTELRYRVWNPYMEWLTGLKEANVLGHQPLEFFPFLTKHGVDVVHLRALRGETLESEPIRYQLGEGRDGWSSGVWGPLRDTEGKIIGALGFVRDITERVRTQDRLQTLSRRLISAQEQERRHLAIELHDEIGQVLTAVSLDLQSLHNHTDPIVQQRVEDCMSVVKDAIRRVRELSLNLRPSLLDDLGLQPALRWFLDQQGQRSGLEFHLDCDVQRGQVAHDIETASFRIVQESVTNILRHANAKTVHVKVRLDSENLYVEVRDNGVGFKTTDAMAKASEGRSSGILGMHERVELLGGRFQVESTPERGTAVSAMFPISPLLAASEVASSLNQKSLAE